MFRVDLGQQSDYVFYFMLALYAGWIVFNLSPLGDWSQDLTLNTRNPSPRELVKLNAIVDELNNRGGQSGLTTFPSPRLRMISDEFPNAIAFGSRSVAMTTGLLKGDEDQARAVFAHELGHLVNKDTLYLSLKTAALHPLIVIWDFVCLPILNFQVRGIISGMIKLVIMLFLSWLFILAFPGVFVLRVSNWFEKLLSSPTEYRADNYAVRLTRDEGLPNFLDLIAPLDVAPANTFMASYVASHPETELRHAKAEEILQEVRGGGERVKFLKRDEKKKEDSNWPNRRVRAMSRQIF